MVRARYSFIFIAFIVLLLAASAVADSIVTVKAVNNKIKLGQSAEFSLFLFNNATSAQTYTSYLMQYAQGWHIDTSPIEDKVVLLQPGENKTISVVAKAVDTFAPGMYEIPIFVKTQAGETFERAMRIMVLPEKPFDYLPAIKATVDMNEKVDPKQPLAIKLVLENKNPLNLTHLKISMQSDLGEFMKDAVIDLPPLQRKTVDFTVVPNPYQSPGPEVLFFVFEYRGEQVKIIEKHFEFISVLPAFSVTDAVHKVVFKQFHQLEIKNEGNVKNTQEVKVPISFFQYLFESSEGKVKVENGQRHLTFEVTLGPSESTQVNYVYNYRILLYLGILALIIIIFYYAVKSPVVIAKKALTARSDDRGALSELKVHLDIKSRSSKPVHNVKVIDYVPAIGHVEKHSDTGSISPQEILHTSRGTKVIWHIAEMEPGEHIQATYKIKAKLNILGTFTLPRASVECSTTKGRRKKSYSSVFSLN